VKFLRPTRPVVIPSFFNRDDGCKQKITSGPACSKEPVSLFGLNGRFFAPACFQEDGVRRGCQVGLRPREAAWS
jgi:hypothetical protein